jgi:hypothetical protein
MVKIVTQYSICLANKPDQLAELCRLLAERGISILGMSSFTLADISLVRFVARGKTEEEVRDLLWEKGYRPTLSFVLEIPPDAKSDRFHRLTAIMAKAGMNIQGIYGGAGEGAGTVYLNPDDFEKAQKVIEKELAGG